MLMVYLLLAKLLLLEKHPLVRASAVTWFPIWYSYLSLGPDTHPFTLCIAPSRTSFHFTFSHSSYAHKITSLGNGIGCETRIFGDMSTMGYASRQVYAYRLGTTVNGGRWHWY